MSLSLCHDQPHERGRSFIHATAKAAKVWADQVLGCKPIHYNTNHYTTLTLASPNPSDRVSKLLF